MKNGEEILGFRNVKGSPAPSRSQPLPPSSSSPLHAKTHFLMLPSDRSFSNLTRSTSYPLFEPKAAGEC